MGTCMGVCVKKKETETDRKTDRDGGRERELRY